MGRMAPTLMIEEGRGLAAQWPDGARIPIHPIWLRERSGAASEVDPGTGQRLYDPSDLPLDLAVRAVKDLGRGRLRISFSDGHEAVFDATALAREIALPAGDHDVPERTLWTGELTNLPWRSWEDQPSDETKFDWVTTFLKYGFILFKGVPSKDRSVTRVAKVFGHIRDTNFGDMFDVRSIPGANDLAYTALELSLHTDNPYRSPVPGVQLLHCLVNETSGGLSTLADGAAAAEALRASDPAAFEVLSRTPVRYRFQDRTTELVASATPIVLNAAGEVEGVHISSRLDFVSLMPPEALSEYYRARMIFDRMLKDRAFEIRFRLDDGDLVMFDNVRLLHGRTSFDPAEGLRHLQGCYIDIDGPRSLYRVLRRSFVH
jgi:gamma-butyrobetaine dioxygenase